MGNQLFIISPFFHFFPISLWPVGNEYVKELTFVWEYDWAYMV